MKEVIFLLSVHWLLIENDRKKEEGLENDGREEDWMVIRTKEEMLCFLFIFKFPRRELKGWLLELK